MISVDLLHPLEIQALRLMPPEDSFNSEQIIKRTGYSLGQCNQAFSWLTTKGLISEKNRIQSKLFELTELGKRYKTEGFPEEKILDLLDKKTFLSIKEISEELKMEQREVGSAFGTLVREGSVIMSEDHRVSSTDKESLYVKILSGLLRNLAVDDPGNYELLNEEEKTLVDNLSRKRGIGKGAFRIIIQDEVDYSLTLEGKKIKESVESIGLTGEEIGALTPKMLAEGSWRDKNFRRYVVNSPASRVLLGRRNPYGKYLDHVREKLTGLGFQEFDGPLVETNFWCCDALFMPQYHAARDEHDVYFIKGESEANEIQQPFLDQVAMTHQNGWNTGSRGWGYRFDKNFAKKNILRSQGTVVSAKTLTTAKTPGKYFGIMRCFRPDEVDASHLSDFYQTEGIVLGKDVNLRTLLGLLKMFAEEVAGAKKGEVKYEPAYFPFTEPSVEIFIRHEVLGWIELGGAGIFRPEVTEPLGVSVPVLAWGLGVDRMAMMTLGIEDIRELFSLELDKVRRRVGN